MYMSINQPKKKTMNNILIAGSLVTRTLNTPINANAFIKSLSDIEQMENPAIGETFFCEETQKLYVITKLKSKVVSGITFENAAVDKYSEIISTATNNYFYEQQRAAKTWEVTHNLNKYPSVTVIDTEGRVAYGEIVYNSLNKVTLSFSAAFSGSVTLN